MAEPLELVPGSRYVNVADAGHMVAGDDTDVLTENLAELLDEVSGADELGTDGLTRPHRG